MILNRITKYNAPIARKEFSHWRGLEKDYNFAVDKKTDSQLATAGVTFTRASLAQYNDSSGNLVASTSGEPVYEYSGSTSLGLRIEKGTTNTIRNTSLDGDYWSASGGYWQGAATTGPDGGGASGIRFEGEDFSTAAAYHVAWDAAILTDGSGTAHRNGWSGSIYAKQGNATFLGMTFSSGAKVGAAFNLADGSVVDSEGCTASTEDVGGGWYRCKCENLSGIATYGIFGFTPSKTSALVWDDSGYGSWDTRADYYSSGPTVPNYIYLFGPQFENSTFCTSYMANPSKLEAGVVRAADICSITGSDFSSFYNATEGTFAVEGRRSIAGSSALPTLLEVNDNSTSDTMGFNTSATKEQFDVYDGSGAASVLAGPDIEVNTTFKVSGGYEAGNYGSSLNGATVVTNSLAAIPTVDQLHFGASEHGSRELNGHIGRVRYYNRRLTDKQLKILADKFNTYSVAFNGTDEYVDTGLQPDFIHTNATMSYWCKMDNFTGVQLMGCSNSKRFYAGFNGTNAYLGVADSNKSSTDISSYIEVGKWHHICLVADGGTATYYVDGVSRDTDSYTQDAATNPDTNFLIGANNHTSITYHMEGDIDEVAIWNSALTSAQINDIYNGGVPIALTSLSPLGWWRMGDNDAGTGATITDQGSGGNDGTLVNTPTSSTSIPSP
tara:strand:+ start:2689 stop:4689 length:2001 start_codon:yes stop_codon:yes gene_type:complete